MIEVPRKVSGAVNAQSINSINRATCLTLDCGSIDSINRNILRSDAAQGMQSPRGTGQPARQMSPAYQPAGTPPRASAGQQSPPMGSVQQGRSNSASAAPPAKMRIPPLLKPVQKGQKVPISSPGLNKLDIRIGWNTSNPDCDIDVSAFMLDGSEKVIGDDWFVFYSQPDSPDKSVHFSQSSREDRQEMTVDISKVNSRVKKIVFVLTIYEAAARGLNFSMISDGYIRLLDSGTKQEIVSFKMTEYYDRVRSMMIGEIYEYKGAWKFCAIGNGIAGELEELCRLYGVELQ